jgi:hypothetical protein
MAVLDWVVRCLPGLSILLVLVIAECALQIVQTGLVGLNYPPGLIQGHNPVFAQFLFITYTLILHVLAFLFPVRLCRSVSQASNAIEEVVRARREANAAGKEKCEDDPVFPQPSPSLQQEEVRLTPNETIHAIMVPSYKEDIGVLEDTLNVLASHGMATKSYDVCSPRPTHRLSSIFRSILLTPLSVTDISCHGSKRPERYFSRRITPLYLQASLQAHPIYYPSGGSGWRSARQEQ